MNVFFYFFPYVLHCRSVFLFCLYISSFFFFFFLCSKYFSYQEETEADILYWEKVVKGVWKQLPLWAQKKAKPVGENDWMNKAAAIGGKSV